MCLLCVSMGRVKDNVCVCDSGCMCYVCVVYDHVCGTWHVSVCVVCVCGGGNFYVCIVRAMYRCICIYVHKCVCVHKCYHMDGIDDVCVHVCYMNVCDICGVWEDFYTCVVYI